MSPRRDRTAGFSLVEMLVVLAILALVAGLGAGTLARRAADPTPLQTAERLAATFRAARAEALRTGTAQRVAVDLAGRRVVWPADAEALRLPPGTRATGVLGRTGGAAGLVFRADGSASGGTIEIRDASRGARVAVDWLTGLPRVAPLEAP